MKKLETKTVRQLMDLAREWGISGYSKLKKAELVKLLAGSKMVKKLRVGRRPADTASRTARQAAAKARKAASRALGKRRPYAKPEAESKPAKESKPARRPAKASPARERDAAFVAARPHKPEGGGTKPVAGKDEVTDRFASTEPRQKGQVQPQSDSRMVLLVRDPTWLYCYWDLSPELAEKLWKGPQPYLRVVELRGSHGPREVQRFEVPPGARSWYIKLDSSGRTHRCELGVMSSGGDFEVMVHSNLSTSPPERLSSMRKARYVQHHPAPKPASQAPETGGHKPARDEKAEGSGSLVQLSLGSGPGLDSAAAQAALQERLDQSLASEVLQSQGLVEGSARRADSAQEADSYWLWVDADIIIYGATVPGSKVSLRGVDLPLDETGRFSARFALPDGELDLPVEGISPKRNFRKRVRLLVERSTEGDPHPRRIGS